MRFGTVTLIGRTNVGKSTFLNEALGEPLAIISPLPQTTRDALLGVVAHGENQIAFVDTPGVHKARNELGKRMNAAAYDALSSADVFVMMTDVWQRPPKSEKASAWSQKKDDLDDPWIRPGDKEVLLALKKRGAPCILAINKVDLTKDKSRLLPMLEAYGRAHDFSALIPVSVRRKNGFTELLDEIALLLPEGPPGYDAETLTNRPVLFFVREYIREAMLNQLVSEVPHAVAVSIDHADEQTSLLRLSATIHVEKLGQRKIVVGKGGAQIKAIGIAARERIEALVGKKVHLELFVRITKEWKNASRQLAELGYDQSAEQDNHDDHV
jgi:GTP-binding protein Era